MNAFEHEHTLPPAHEVRLRLLIERMVEAAAPSSVALRQQRGSAANVVPSANVGA